MVVDEAILDVVERVVVLYNFFKAPKHAPRLIGSTAQQICVSFHSEHDAMHKTSHQAHDAMRSNDKYMETGMCNAAVLRCSRAALLASWIARSCLLASILVCTHTHSDSHRPTPVFVVRI